MNYSSKVDEYNKQVHGLEKKDYSELVEKLVTLKVACGGRSGSARTQTTLSRESAATPSHTSSATPSRPTGRPPQRSGIRRCG